MFRKTLKIITDHIATLNGQTFAYKLIQSPIARTIRLKINMNSGLEIIVPRRLSPLGHFRPDHLDDIFQKHENWILKQLIKLEARKKLRDQHQLQNGSTLTILGEPHKIKILPGYSKKPKIKRVQSLIFTNESAIIDAHTFNIYCDGTIPHAKKTIEKYLHKVAEKFFARRTNELAQQMQLTFNRITVRGQKTRWGSCSRQKNLNFNWRLIMLPVVVAESVIIHELAHTVHMNHSRNFYALVGKHCPAYRKLQKYLRHPHFLL